MGTFETFRELVIFDSLRNTSDRLGGLASMLVKLTVLEGMELLLPPHVPSPSSSVYLVSFLPLLLVSSSSLSFRM